MRNQNESLSPEVMCRFATEKINLPRGKVLKTSLSSSPAGSKKTSPFRLPRDMDIKEPAFAEKSDYYKEYWKMYFQNESLVADIESTSKSNYKMLKKGYNLEDYYEHHLVP